jgi:NADPH-dependent 2,4-dienoyl-CoA reductase/sulfur reductase-like enzyme
LRIPINQRSINFESGELYSPDLVNLNACFVKIRDNDFCWKLQPRTGEERDFMVKKIIEIAILALAIFFVRDSAGAGRRSEANDIEAAYDVVVAGGGISGMAAALQAYKMGASVLVVEPSSWIGGQAAAAGVSNMDDLLPTRSGLYRAFIAKARRYYDAMGKSMGTGHWYARSISFEPSVGRRMLYEMAEEARASGDGRPLHILLRASVTGVKRQGSTVTGVAVLEGGESREIKCGVLIDATEYGDVIPLAGAE